MRSACSIIGVPYGRRPQQRPARHGRAPGKELPADPMAPDASPGVHAAGPGPGPPHGPVHTHLAHRHRAGRQDPGVAAGEDGVGHRHLAPPGQDGLSGDGDRPGGRLPAQGRGALGQGAPVQRLFLHHHLCGDSRLAEGAGAAASGPLRRVHGRPGRHGPGSATATSPRCPWP